MQLLRSSLQSCQGTPRPVTRPLSACRAPAQQPRRVQAAATYLDGQSDAWERLCLVKTKLEHAVQQEDFTLAAKLRDESKALAEQLPPIQQYLWHQLGQLRSGSINDKLKAISALGEAGDDSIIPDLAPLLKDAQLQAAAHNALWAVFSRSRHPSVNELMAVGCACISNSGKYEAALKVFGDIIALEPDFAEGYNKRATVLYLMQRYSESIADCTMVLQLNPHHFGAASGMGLCYVALRDYKQALEAFERALAIHPGLTQIQDYVEALRSSVKEGGLGGSTGGMERSD